ncbi:MAG: TraR/DksA C4-type zinc finger protein [Candidatus Omnitrophica bacterium]|nr:TraR/DksA C4-type zinc finger protein [Candidatus Omnitrophota bacterium]MBU1630694.1 TraR/DksA C4-type zinc finger protein [Candidatus Omnitrophota bacterium]MBU1889626.1 TraR/DksA C4-type zinc finger protein [Candidatus Omnitrophota bacterium]
MKAKDIKIFKETLLKEKERLFNDLDDKEKKQLGKSFKDVSGEISSHKIHMADLASDSAEENTSLDLLSSEEKLLRQIQDAINRIERKNYGKCSQCNKTISIKRLKAVPYAELCLKCKENEEKSL